MRLVTLAADLQTLLNQGTSERVYEQASVAVYRSGQLALSVGTHDPDAIFDVASVTKVLTAVLTLKHLGIDEPWPWAGATGADLLSHRSGLEPWLPFYAAAAQVLRVDLQQLIRDPSLQEQARFIIATMLTMVPRVAQAPAPTPTYSDLNFLLLGETIAGHLEQPLPEVAREALWKPLGLDSMQWGGERPDAVSTGRGRPRSGNPPARFGRQSTGGHRPADALLQKVSRKPVLAPEEQEVVALARTLQAILDGSQPIPDTTEPTAADRAVDDDNAASMGGLCGHAGLWSNARDLAKLGDALRRCAEGKSDIPLAPDRARLLFEKACGTRTYGLDTPSGDTPAIGSVLGKGPKGAAGHLGFTGCSLWIDRDAELSIALLSNAVIVERPNPRLKAFRPRVHDLIAKCPI